MVAAPTFSGVWQMGIFGAIKDTYRKSEAAVVVQNLLMIQFNAMIFIGDPAKEANRLVGAVWNFKPDVFSGSFGQRPHKITIAACALAFGIPNYNLVDINRNALLISLGNVLAEIEVNGRLYGLNTIDFKLIEDAGVVFSSEMKRAKNAMGVDAEIHKPNWESYENWYHAFKVAVSEEKHGLQMDSNGKSLVDFMVDEPLRRAFRDGIDPVSLGKDFANSFNINKMGFR